MYENKSAAALFTVVCIFGDGKVNRFERGTLEAALSKLDECQETGRYASGSIWTGDDEELDGFTRPANRNFHESPCDTLRD